ncbi:MAG: flavodoxin-dependent (E)-4-hydroxy-3-methylbut-2-enyl-diphosphate synthase [Anaerofustis stercorihominis]|nr:flavodoxin-dependent (E)-4-hydroxy-3-methylbut-2-enyl-diphosphate synthase [Anaerofustis stercorihominis]
MSKVIRVANTFIGGENPVTVQSMLNVPLTDTENAIKQAVALEEAGCEIVRASIPNRETAEKIPEIVSRISIPFVADIHFDHRLAILSAKNGAHKIRVNPGNIGGKDKVKEVVEVLKDLGLPARIGVNAGSLEKDLLEKYGRPTAEAMVESAERHIAMFNEFDYDNIAVSLKSSDTKMTIDANRLFAKKYDYPIHLGVTEAGFGESAIVRSAVGIGSLLIDGIGDTIRVSLTGSPIPEIEAGKEILKACGLLNEGIRIVSCPTCARCKTDTLSIVKEIKELTAHIKKPITVAVMGCSVNGPGEASQADVGIACGREQGKLFEKGQVVATVKKADYTKVLLERINELAGEK